MKTRITLPIVILATICSFTSVFADAPGQVLKVKKSWRKPVYTVQTDSAVELRVTFYRPDVFRIQAATNGVYADPKNDPEQAQILVIDKIGKTKVKKQESAGKITFKTKAVTLTLNKATAQFELHTTDGKRLWSETAPLTFGDHTNTVQTLSTDIDEHFFGGGQQNGYFTHKGTKIDIRADGNWDEGGHPNPAPFYMSKKGYAVLRNTFSTGAYDFASNESIQLEHNETRFDAYYFVGSTLNRMVDLYTEFTGRPNFVCMWAMELGEADAYMTRDKETKELVKDEDGNFVEITPHVIERLAKKYREHDMPGGWILPNDGYGCGYTNLVEVVEELATLGFYTGLWTEKDLTKTEWEVGTAGIRVQKLDVAWTWPAYQFALEANKKAWSSLTSNSDSRGMVWTVQGWAGTQRYGICWTGDQYGTWDLIRYHIPTLIGSGLSGQAYATTDVDGIFGGSPETYTRDLQWKCFTPVLYAMNGWAGISKSPWAYEEPYRSINRDYLKLKMRMTPYMYHYTREAWDTGAPITRGMIWEFPDDPKTWDRTTQHQYMLGESILVAPVYTSMKMNKGWRKEDIYLPEGRWIDYSDGRTIDGPLTIDAYPITLEKLPLFVRGGGIIPMYPEMLYNNQLPKDPLTFDCYPHGESQFELYEDDGITRKYQQGESARQLITMQAPEGKAGDVSITIGKSIGQFDGKLESRVYEILLRTPYKPTAVSMNGAPVTEWSYDAENRGGTVSIHLPRVSTDSEVTLLVDIDESLPTPDAIPYPVPEITPDLDATEFTITASSEQGGAGINNAFDGTPETIWHSNYGKQNPGKHPYTVDVDLGALRAINGFTYLPRQIGTNGRIADYELYVGRTAETLGKPVHTGTFENSTNLQSVAFTPSWGKVVRLKILSDVNGTNFATAAEFEIKQDLNAPALADEIVFLSDLKPASEKGEWKKDQSIGGKIITVNEQTYEKGIGARSGSELVYTLDGSWDRLSGHVGMDDEVGDAGSVMFRVYGDGKLIFESPEMTGTNIKQLMDLSIIDVKELRLVLLDLGDGSENDHGDWVDAKLVRKGSE